MSRDLEQRLRDARDALPSPAARSTFEARELVLGALVRRRRTRVRATAAVVVLVAATVVGIGAGLWIAPSGGASAPSVTGLGFLPAKGWTIVQSAPGPATRSNAVAANVPVLPSDMPVDGPPYRTIRTLPPDGVVIFAEFTARGRSWEDLGYPTDGAPRLDEAYRETDWSAQIRPEDPLAQYRLAFATSGYNVDVRVYAGRLHPKEEQLAEAQRQLDRMIVASDPITLQASPLVASWGGSVTFTGSVSSGRGNETIDIEERRCGAVSLAWSTVAGAHTDPGGGWSIKLGAPITSSFRAVWNGKTSNVVTVRARPEVIVRQSARTRFFVSIGAFKPFEGRQALLERFDRAHGRWVRVKRFRLTDSGVAGVVTWSTARVPAYVKKGTLVRAVLPRASSGPCYLAGYSNLLTTAR